MILLNQNKNYDIMKTFFNTFFKSKLNLEEYANQYMNRQNKTKIKEVKL